MLFDVSKFLKARGVGLEFEEDEFEWRFDWEKENGKLFRVFHISRRKIIW